MSLITPVTSRSEPLDVGAASAQFATLNAMAAGQWFRFFSNVACWIAQGADPTAAANTAGSMPVAAGEAVLINGALGAKLAVIQDTGGGKAVLTPVQVI